MYLERKNWYYIPDYLLALLLPCCVLCPLFTLILDIPGTRDNFVNYWVQLGLSQMIIFQCITSNALKINFYIFIKAKFFDLLMTCPCPLSQGPSTSGAPPTQFEPWTPEIRHPMLLCDSSSPIFIDNFHFLIYSVQNCFYI